MTLSCGGTIQVVRAENVSCYDVSVNGSDFVDRMSCRLNNTGNDIVRDSGEVFVQVTGMVLFSCRGTNNRDMLAAAELSNVPVSNCTVSSALSNINGSAASLVSLGRFCQSYDDWRFWNLLSACEGGKRGDIINRRILVDSNAINKLPSKHIDPSVSMYDQRHLQVQLDVVLYKFIDRVDSFCYNTATCSDTVQCSLDVISVTTEDNALLERCPDPVYDNNVERLWNEAKIKLDPSVRVEAIISDVLNA
jgi:hypothetical protein